MGNSDQQSVFAAGTERILRESDIACLHEGDRVVDGKLYDADGREVPVIPNGHTMSSGGPNHQTVPGAA